MLARKNCKGATLTEVIITTALFSLLMLTLFSVIRYGMSSWRVVEGRSSLQTTLRKVEVFMLDDVRRASYNYLNTENPTDIGKKVWFCSALDGNNDGSGFKRDETGKPLWSKNILYYCTNLESGFHNSIYGFECKNDEYCPHKWLIRKEIKADNLLTSADINKYTSVRPSSYSLTDMCTGDCQAAQLLAENVLAFQVALKAPEVIVTIKAFRAEEATHEITVGDTDLTASRYTIQYEMRVVPNN